MAEAFLIAGLVAAIAAVACYMSWDLSVSLDRDVRRGRIAAARRDRAVEDAAWAAFRAGTAERHDLFSGLLVDEAALARLRELVDAYVPETEEWPVVA